MKSLVLVTALFFSFQMVWAQDYDERALKGKVVVSDVDLKDIYIINLRTEATTNTESEGFFTIKAAVGDTLMFSAIQIKGKKVVLSAKDFQTDLVLIPLEPMINRLDEVIVKQYKNINAVALGIIPAKAKQYTPAERKLQTASGDGFDENTDGTSGGSVGLDPLFNWMSGRTTLLKKELEVERKESLLQRLEAQFGVDYFVQKLKIPADYVKAFWYFVVEDARFVRAFKAKNSVMTKFVLSELAVKYLELQKTETN